MKPEDVAHWYIRLNGFLTTPNFVVHPPRKGAQRTDADIIGVRFPYREEFPQSTGADEAEFQKDRPYLLIAEVKSGRCGLNQSWRQPANSALSELLRDIGPFPALNVPEVTDSLLREGFWDRGSPYASLFFIGTDFDPGLPRGAPKRSWIQVLAFIYERFQEYDRIKADHDQWDATGKELWIHCMKVGSREAFISNIRRTCGLP